MIPKINFSGNMYLTSRLESKCPDKTSQNELKHIKHYAHEFDCDIVVFDKQDKKPFEASKYDAYCFDSHNSPAPRTFVIGSAGIEGVYKLNK